MIVPIYKDEIPYTFEMVFDEVVYNFEINYNDLFDFFTLDLSTVEEVLITGEKLVYGQQSFRANAGHDLPNVMPYDLSQRNQVVTWDNFGELIELIIQDESQIDEDLIDDYDDTDTDEETNANYLDDFYNEG